VNLVGQLDTISAMQIEECRSANRISTHHQGTRQ
jgi:hypothetical protein